jgi:hypothetical protein
MYLATVRQPRSSARRLSIVRPEEPLAAEDDDGIRAEAA